MKRMTAKYPGTCRVCGKEFGAGTPIAWYGRGQHEHDTAECRPAPVDGGPHAAVVAAGPQVKP